MALEELQMLAEAATPGPWTARGLPYDGINDPIIEGAHGLYVCQTVYDMQSITQEHGVDADTAYIAGASPDTVLALIARLREAERLLGNVWFQLRVVGVSSRDFFCIHCSNLKSEGHTPDCGYAAYHRRYTDA